MTDTTDNTPETFTAEQMREVRAEAAKWRKQLREVEAERDQLTQQVNDITAERDKAFGERDAAAAERDELKAAGELAGITREVAEANGIPAEALRGSTREELEAHAAVLKPVFAKANGPYVPTIGDRPETNVSSEAAFAAELFNSNSYTATHESAGGGT